MKKIIIAAFMLLGFAGAASAQTPAATQQKKGSSATTHAAHKPASLTKADGSADMRFKANKKAKPTVKAHLKKDGSVDKRFKATKTN